MQPILSSKQIMDTYGGKLENASGSKGKKSSKRQDTIVVALEGVAEPRDGTLESRPRAGSDDIHFSQEIIDPPTDPPQRPIEQVMFKLPPCILMTVLYTSEYDCY